MDEITTIEMHTGGEPVRIVTGGWPEVVGETILDKRRYARERLEDWRKMIIFEPRGHFDMYAAVPVAPDLPGCDMGVLFLHNEGYSTMCGHAVIALGRYAVDHGLVAAVEPVTRLVIQCPCGPVAVEVDVLGGKSGAVRFVSVPSFAFALDAEDHATLNAVLDQADGPKGDVYSLERDRTSRHGRIMKYNLNANPNDAVHGANG